MLDCQKDINQILQENSDLIKLLSSTTFEDCASIENSHL